MWKNKTIFQKMFHGTMILMILTLLMYYIFVFYYEYKNSAEKTIQESVELSDKINAALKDYVTQIDGTIASFYFELYRNETGALASLLRSDKNAQGFEKTQQDKLLTTYFTQLFMMRRDFVDVYIYMNPDKDYLFSNYGGKTLNYVPDHSEWYQDTLDRDGRTNIVINYIPEHMSYKKPVIGFSRKLKNIDDEGIVEDTVIMLDFTMKNLDTLIDTYITNDMTTVMLVDEAGEIVYQRGAFIDWSERGHGAFDGRNGRIRFENTGGERYIIAGCDEKVYEWNVVIATNMDYIFMKIKDYLILAIEVEAVLILMSVGLSWFLAKSISRPIQILEKGMQTIQSGNFDIRLKKETDDELGRLIEDFNEMAYHTKKLIKEKYEEELQRKEAQYRFLQAQIDPHFIFNTLQIISSMAVVYKTPEIEVMSNSLAELIRYSISGDEKTIQLKEELKNVKSYLDIQKIRFKNRFTYQIEVEKGLENLPIIKLVLQPIVENSINYGLKNRKENGRIEIRSCRHGNAFYLEIKDNGQGMAKDELEKLMKHINEPLRRVEDGKIEKEPENVFEKKRNHVGLRNINLRLKMYYGETYGLLIESKKDVGTVVRVCIRKEGEDGKAADCG